MSRAESIFGKRPGLTEKEDNSLSVTDKDIAEIQGLHKSIGANLNNALQNAILIGEILQKKKKELKHGEFIPWIEKNLPFTRMTANKYLRLFENKHLLPNVNSGLHLTEALKILSGPETGEKEINPTRSILEIYKDFQDGRTLTKTERTSLRSWLNKKAIHHKEKATEFEKQAKKLK
ncbi:DUF3102 domain-containing protein [Leptospira levettii]|uniref:DUF3102 domain-containing protein n=1 Tax=Leptospira levettii TaxID=2023178 RepID=UPI001092F3F5|nr:DUF3102 domain-containing protein [Leptospira levettii]TGM78610.1 DUF3102 domain-containing protein [Leptospira levettii]